jgi:hypothetical protein
LAINFKIKANDRIRAAQIGDQRNLKGRRLFIKGSKAHKLIADKKTSFPKGMNRSLRKGGLTYCDSGLTDLFPIA